LSFVKDGLPSGPCVVLVLSIGFAVAYLTSPRYGVVTRAIRRWRQARRTQRENALKSVYLAGAGSSERGVPVTHLAEFRKESVAQVQRLVGTLVRRRWARVEEDVVFLTDRGEARARELDRNYKLWELFLTREVNLPADHTQRDAENLEHILGPSL